MKLGVTRMIPQTINILGRTPAVLSSLLKDAPAELITSNEGPDTWSPFDIIGHLIQGETTDWIPRTRMILNYGESRTFEPFDRFAQFEMSKGKSINNLLQEFDTLRHQNLDALKEMQITADQLSLRGTHPSLGSVTLRELLSTWVAHDLSHIAQAVRVMCRQYTDDVGPWKEFLPILSH